MKKTNQLYDDTDFTKQDLSDSLFEKCTFIRCDFNHANLRDAHFVDCTFIRQGDIEGCDFGFVICVMPPSRIVSCLCLTLAVPTVLD